MERRSGSRNWQTEGHLLAMLPPYNLKKQTLLEVKDREIQVSNKDRGPGGDLERPQKAIVPPAFGR